LQLSENSDPRVAQKRFLAKWNAIYPETPPVSHYFKHRLNKRWARIHSLPNAKRYPETKAEWTELEHRQNAVIDHLVPQDTPIRVIVNSIDSHNHLFNVFHFENIGVFVDREAETVYQSFQFETTWRSNALNIMLIMIAEDTMRAFIMAPNCLIAPYDGGMDIILEDPGSCWAFKRQFKAWLSERPDGL
jgi:hypothetical protein